MSITWHSAQTDSVLLHPQSLHPHSTEVGSCCGAGHREVESSESKRFAGAPRELFQDHPRSRRDGTQAKGEGPAVVSPHRLCGAKRGLKKRILEVAEGDDM
jgi:hypothetical protein